MELPRPRADLAAPATVAILPADNVELTPAAKGMIGLTPQQAAPSMDLSADRASRQQEPLYYRADPDKAVFAAGFRVYRRTIGVAVTTQFHFDESAAQVRETLAYTIAHERVGQLILDVPGVWPGRSGSRSWSPAAIGRWRRWNWPTRAIRARRGRRGRRSGGCCGCRRDALGRARW